MGIWMLLDCAECRIHGYAGGWFWGVMLSTFLILYADFWLAPKWSVRLQNGIASVVIGVYAGAGYWEAVYGVAIGFSLVALALFSRVIWPRLTSWCSHLCTVVSRLILFGVLLVPGMDFCEYYFHLRKWCGDTILVLASPIFFGSYGCSLYRRISVRI